MHKMFKKIWVKGTEFLTKKQEGIASAAAIMMIIMLATKVVGFLRQFLFAHQFGASRELDMFIASNTIPEMIVNLLILGSVNAALIPVVSQALHKEGEEYTRKLVQGVLTVFGFALLLLSFTAFIFAKPLINWSIALANPLDPFSVDQIDQMVSMMRILLISPAILGISNLITGVLHVYQRFVIPQIAPLLYNLGGLVAIFVLVPFLGIKGLAIGVIIGSVLHLAIQLPLLKHLGLSLKFNFDLKNSYILRMGKLMVPRVLGLAASQVSMVVDRLIALGLLAGSVSALVFGESIKIIPVSMFGLTFAAAAFPVLSKEAASGKIDDFKDTLVRSINQIIFLSVPVTAILAILRVPIVRLFLGMGSGRFSWEDTLTTAWVLLFFSLGLVAESLISLIIKAFYSLHDTKTPVVVSIVTILFSIVTSITLTNLFSHFVNFNLGQFLQSPEIIFEWLVVRNGEQSPAVGGLALSSSLTVTIEVIVLTFLLHKKVGGFSKIKLYVPVLKKILIGVITAFVMYFVYSMWDTVLNTSKTFNIFVLTSATSVAGLSIYVILSYLFNCREVEIIEKSFQIALNAFENWRVILKRTFTKSTLIEE